MPIAWNGFTVIEQSFYSGILFRGISIWQAITCMAVPLCAVLSTSRPKANFLYFLSIKRVWNTSKNCSNYFPILYFCVATSQNWIWALPPWKMAIESLNFTDFGRLAATAKIWLAEFYLATCYQMYSVSSQTKHGNLRKKNMSHTSVIKRHPFLKPLFVYRNLTGQIKCNKSQKFGLSLNTKASSEQSLYSNEWIYHFKPTGISFASTHRQLKTDENQFVYIISLL